MAFALLHSQHGGHSYNPTGKGRHLRVHKHRTAGCSNVPATIRSLLGGKARGEDGDVCFCWSVSVFVCVCACEIVWGGLFASSHSHDCAFFVLVLCRPRLLAPLGVFSPLCLLLKIDVEAGMNQSVSVCVCACGRNQRVVILPVQFSGFLPCDFSSVPARHRRRDRFFDTFPNRGQNQRPKVWFS